jgi:hypothetical protein
MKSKFMMFGMVAAGLSGLTANACDVEIRVACPNDTPAVGVQVCINGIGCALTDDLGLAMITVPVFDTYTISVTGSTLPPGAKLAPSSVKLNVVDDAPPLVNFVLSGPFCSVPPAPGPCWLTGGGTIGKSKGVANYSFGGVVYPGCSPKAADGGNWNVVDHNANLHFQGQQIFVDACYGQPTSSPKVNVNVIDFHGFGTIVGVAGNPLGSTPVSFVGHAVDNQDGGAGADQLYLTVQDASNNTLLQIGNSAADPATISTGNLQIHTTGCNK